MNAVDVLKYGHLTVHGTLERIPEADRNEAGVCGVWSVRQIIAHLASYERLLEEVLGGFISEIPMPLLESFMELQLAWNDVEVAKRDRMSTAETIAEYDASYKRVVQLIREIPADVLREPGTLPWYGLEYSLDDFLVYQYYGHKREHCAQIGVFADVLAARGERGD